MRTRPVLLITLVVGLALAAVGHAAVAPNAVTGGVQSVTSTSALLNGNVDPNGTETLHYFQYGTTASYGQRTPNRSAGNGANGVAVQAPVANLTPNTVYHYRVVAVAGSTTTRGADRTFKTALAIVPEPSKLELARATISASARWIDVLAPITSRASGTVSLELFGARQVTRWTAPIDSADGRVRTRQAIAPAQAAMGTGILTINYKGDADTRPQVVRLRAANNPADLEAVRPTIVNGRIQASGTISPNARGVVRVQLEYYSAGKTTTLEKYATIANGSWRLDEPLSAAEQSAISTRRGTVHSYILFTGYLPAKMRGEMQAYEVLGAQ